MSQVGLQIALLFLLIVANGVFAMAELAVASSRKIRLQQRAEAGDAGAEAALNLANDPDRFLSTVQA
jgi:putative hemolysin